MCKKILLILIISMFSVNLYAEKAEIYQKKGYAITGYDPVAYLTKYMAIKGNKQFSHEWKSATWLFSTKENMTLFITNPEKYAPQYGGYCAYAMAQDYFASTDPKAFTIYKNKLYLNYSIGVRSDWLKAKDMYIRDANINWKKYR